MKKLINKLKAAMGREYEVVIYHKNRNTEHTFFRNRKMAIHYAKNHSREVGDYWEMFLFERKRFMRSYGLKAGGV